MIVKIPPPLFRSHFQFYVRRNLSRSKLSWAIAMLWQACHYTCQDCRKRGEGFSPSLFGRTVDPISTRGADYANHSTTAPHPDFQTLRRPCLSSPRTICFCLLGYVELRAASKDVNFKVVLSRWTMILQYGYMMLLCCFGEPWRVS